MFVGTMMEMGYGYAFVSKLFGSGGSSHLHFRWSVCINLSLEKSTKNFNGESSALEEGW